LDGVIVLVLRAWCHCFGSSDGVSGLVSWVVLMAYFFGWCYGLVLCMGFSRAYRFDGLVRNGFHYFDSIGYQWDEQVYYTQ
jgi:hypothetical protein